MTRLNSFQHQMVNRCSQEVRKFPSVNPWLASLQMDNLFASALTFASKFQAFFFHLRKFVRLFFEIYFKSSQDWIFVNLKQTLENKLQLNNSNTGMLEIWFFFCKLKEHALTTKIRKAWFDFCKRTSEHLTDYSKFSFKKRQITHVICP